ncbi:proteinase inhibitor I78 [Peterkaempfera bronchialis]|uniref:Proteinase inhibitor I78 n=1 Tax=Peterkaempfera bronchialis TaxID=2126346 RepID=A0A345SSQ1_9ACTN|nr:proteinase inhibitor I78 [Peterkaempfera bronchialis]AXI76756.1 proteinase inhibitor I78 [Peterkaempfera bronchialis]
MSEQSTPPHEDPEGYVGLSAEQAEAVARQRGWTTVRVVARDALVTLEYRSGRINFAADDGRVVRCWFG